MNFYQALELILLAKDPRTKIAKFNAFYMRYKADMFKFEELSKPLEFQAPSYEHTCQIVPPQDVPKRKNLTTKEGQIYLIHAIAHIEYSAIDLAIDAAYRFRDMPKEYYDDWLSVADDEVRHFEMLEKLLNELGVKYGDVEVHNALFEASQRTQTLLDRMAVVPRYLEANGLDATPLILEKIKRLEKNEMLEKLQDTLEVILEEEVDHVKKGDVWFNYTCQKEGVDPSIYFEIIDKYYPQGFVRPRHINKEARLEAGFSCSELKHIAHKNVC